MLKRQTNGPMRSDIWCNSKAKEQYICFLPPQTDQQ